MSACPAASTARPCCAATSSAPTPTANTAVPEPSGVGAAPGLVRRRASKWMRYTPGCVNAQLMCWWASAGSTEVSAW